MAYSASYMIKPIVGQWGARVLALCAGAALVCASGVILYDETNAATAGSDSIATFGPLYESFSTGPSGGSLSDVLVKLTKNSGMQTAGIRGGAHAQGNRDAGRVNRPAIPANFGTTVALYSDNSTSPGGLLLTIGSVADSSLPASGYANFDLPVSPAYTLSPNTRYWIGFSSNGGGLAGLAWTNDTSGIGSANEFNYFNGTVYPNSKGPYQLRILSAGAAPPPPTPAPPTIFLGLTGLVGASLYLMWRRRTRTV